MIKYYLLLAIVYRQLIIIIICHMVTTATTKPNHSCTFIKRTQHGHRENMCALWPYLLLLYPQTFSWVWNKSSQTKRRHDLFGWSMSHHRVSRQVTQVLQSVNWVIGVFEPSACEFHLGFIVSTPRIVTRANLILVSLDEHNHAFLLAMSVLKNRWSLV